VATATLSAKAQIAIPIEVRRQLGFKPGDRLVLEIQDDHLVIRKAPDSDLKALEAFQGPQWQGYADELDHARDQWDR